MNNSATKETEHLLEEYEDALFRVAMTELEMEKAGALIAEIESGNSGIDLNLADREAARARPKMYRLIERRLRRSGMRHFARSILPRAAVTAACVIAILAVGAATTFAASKTVRSKVFELLINVQTEYTELSLVEIPGSGIDVPAEWQGSYYPAWIPEGFSLVKTDEFPGSYSAYYQENEDSVLIFSEYSVDSSTNINTEDAELTYTEIHGNPALCAKNGDATFVTWSEGSSYFVVIFYGEREIAIKVAESVAKIN